MTKYSWSIIINHKNIIGFMIRVRTQNYFLQSRFDQNSLKTIVIIVIFIIFIIVIILINGKNIIG